MIPFRTIFPAALVVALLLGSCSGNEKVTFKEITVPDAYTLSVPASMEQSNELHDFARLQYSDERKGFFLIGIDEAKEELDRLQLYYGIEDYAHFVTRTVSNGLDTANVTGQNQFEVNGLPLISTDLFGAMHHDGKGLEVYYRLMVLESDRNFYQLIAWTARDKYEIFHPIADQIECSFQELAMVFPADSTNYPAGSEPAGAGSAAETAD